MSIFRLRSGHIPPNGPLNRIGVRISPDCALCGWADAEETVTHNLFECPALEDLLRSEYLPPKPNTASTLYVNPDSRLVMCGALVKSI